MLLVIFFTSVVLSIAASEVWDLGCYSDSRNNREFRVSGGNYKISDTSVQQCTSSCAHGSYRYKYAATEGSYCYCGNTMDKVVKQGDMNKCNNVCTGNVCSDAAYIRIFNTNVSITGLSIKTTGIGFLLEDFAFSTSVSKGATNASYTFNFGDKSYVLSTCCNVSHKYTKTGVFKVKVTARNSQSGPIYASKWVSIESALGLVRMECPKDIVESGNKTQITVSATQGTRLRAKFIKKQGETSIFNMSDALMFEVGSKATFGNMSGSPKSDGAYIKPMSMVKRGGRIMAWELYASKTGIVRLQVYRPVCPSLTPFCPSKFTCKSSSECKSVMEFKCPGSGQMCLYTGKCLPGCNTTRAVFPSSASPLVDYKLIGEVIVKITKVGYNLFTLKPSDTIEVLAGDVIGWSTNSSSGDIAYENSPSDPEYFYPFSSFNIAVGSSLAKGGSATRHDISHVIRAHVSQESLALNDFVFKEAGLFNVSVVVENQPIRKQESQLDFCMISVQDRIVDLQIQKPVCYDKNIGYAAGYAFPLNAVIKKGSNVTYSWNVNGKMTYGKIAEMRIKDVGLHKVALTASNNISACSISTVVSVLTEVGLLAITVSALNEVDIPVNFTALVSKGTNVTLQVHIDGKVAKTFAIQEANNTVFNFSYVFTIGGTKTVKLVASNNIQGSKGKKELSIPVYVKGKIGEITIDVQPQRTCVNVLEIATEQSFEISIYSSLDGIAINYTIDDGVSGVVHKPSLTGKVTYNGVYKQDFTGNIVINASANGEVVTKLISVKASKCGPPAILKPPSYSRKHPMIITKANELELKYISQLKEKPGCVYGRLEFTWRLLKLQGDSELEVPSFRPVHGFSSPTFKVAPLSLEEGNYTINMSLINTATKQCYEYKTFLAVYQSDLFCVVRGGSKRGVAFQSDAAIILDGSGSVDPDQPLNSRLSHRWKCRRANDSDTNKVFLSPWHQKVNQYCNSTTFVDIPISPTDAEAKLDVKHFRENATYEFQHTVQKNERDKSCIQIIRVLPETMPSISIECKSNCRDKVNPFDRLILSSSCANCGNSTDEMVYQWSLRYGGNKLDSKSGNMSITSTGWNRMNMVLLSDTLKERSKYTLAVKVTRRSRSVNTYYNFVTTSRPRDGTCQVIPETGYNLDSKFKILCKSWITEDPQLNYEFHYIHQLKEEARINSLPVEHSLSTLWYFGAFHETPSSHLPIGNEKENYRLPLYVKIINRFGAFTVCRLNVTVEPLTSKETNVKINDITRQLKEDSNQDPQTIIAVVTAASSYLNSKDTEKEVAKDQIERVRYDMVKKLSEIKVESLPMITEQCNALSSAIENNNEVTSKAQILATDSIKRSSKKLKSLAKETGYDKKSPMKVEEAAQSVFSAVSRTFKASESTTQDYLAQVLENLQKEKDAPKSRDWGIRIREWQGEDSAEDAETVVVDLNDAINQVTTAIQVNKVEGENQTLVTTKTFGIQLLKSPSNKIQNATFPVQGADGISMGSFVLPKGENLVGEKYDGKTVGVQILQFKENPVRWDQMTSAFMNSSIIGLELRDEADNEIDVKNTREDIEIWLPVKVTNVEHYSFTFQSKTFQTYHYRVTNKKAVNDPLLIHIKSNQPLTMYLRFGAYPSITDYTLMLNLPCLNDSLPWPYSKVDNYTFLVHDLDRLGMDVFIGLLATELIKPQGLETPGNVGDAEVTQLLRVNYTMDIRSVGCKFWSEKTTKSWSSEGCKVGNKTTYKAVQCLCNHLTFFGPINIKPNPIGKPTFDKLKGGFVSLITVCVILLLYFIALIWARRKDRVDAIKVGACPLPDNDPTDQFRYEVTLWTSMRRYAGTTSKVNIILCGEENDSETRTLEDPERKPCQRGSVDTFLLTTPYMLGSLPYIRIWHDNSGGSWFLSRVMVVDLQNDDHHYFICNRWLAVDEDDGQVERLIPLASKEELTEFQHLFVARTRRNLSDSHLWFSVFARPASSRFTRVQRLTCCLCLLMTSMMASCMYYDRQKVTPNVQNTQSFGGMTITWNEVVIGIITSLLVFPVNLIVVQMFRSVRPKPHRITHRKIPMPPKLSLTVNNLTNYNRMKDSSDSSKGSNNSIDSSQEKNNAKMRLSINDVHTDVDRISFTSSPLLVDNRRPSTMWDTGATTRFDRAVQWFKQHSSLPFYFVYLAWFLAVALTLTAAVIIILYGMEFGNELSLKWLFASAVSFVQDVIITQPLKVLGTAMFFALVVKKPDKGEFEVNNDTAQLAEDEDWLYQTSGDQKKGKKKKVKLLPPDEAKLIAMRNSRMKERKMHSIIREVGSFYIFLCLVMMIAYTHRDFYSFVQNNEIKKLFVEDFEKIKKDHDFWNWTREHLMGNLFPSEWYNGQKLKPQGFLSDKYSQMVGGARLRHIRIQNESCIVPPTTTFINRDCYGEYTMSDEETQDYTVSWLNVTKYDQPVSRKDVSWRYQDWQVLDGYPIWAQLDTYSGGGYVLVLEPGMDNMDNLKKLESEFWIDRHTRAVITEFTIYNAQTNLFSILTLVAEFPASGGVIPYVNIHTARLYNYTQDYMFFVLACEGLFVLFILYFLYRELRKLYKEGTPHFKEFWNIVEIIIVTSAGIGIGLYIYRLLTYTNVLEKSRNAPFQFKSFQFAAYWDETYTMTIAILVTFSTIKLNKLLRFNKRMSLLSSTLKNAAFSLAMFGIIFAIIFLAFTLIGTVVFGTAVRDYRQPGSSFTSLLSLMLGKASYLEMNQANRVIGPLYFFCFMFLVSMVLINMFLSIIIDSYHEVKRDLEKQNNEYEIVDFIIERFKLWSGIGKAPKPQFQSRHVKWDVAHAKVKTVYAFRNGRDDYVTELENRLELLMKRTDQLFCEVFPERVRRPTIGNIMKPYKPDHKL